MRRYLSGLFSLLLAATVAAAPPAPPERGIGNVHMPISCGAEANAGFDRGLALLHSFWYDRALSEFNRVIAAHPDCAIAYWGAAMTYNHPLWAPPPQSDVAAALDVLRRASTATTKTDREARYLAAVVTLYGNGDPSSKHARDVAYRDAMRGILAAYPDDETKLFTSLAIQGAGGLDTPARLEAAALAEDVHGTQPQHPGALHYLIHAYDSDALAERGVPAARAYAASAPAIPHALHMPSHIFVRLGMWDDARTSNIAAWDASVDAVRAAHQPSSEREFHDLQFGQYAALQLGRYAEAKRQAIVALDQYDENMRTIARGGLSRDAADELQGLDFEAVCMATQYILASRDFSLMSRLPATTNDPLVRSMLTNVRAVDAIARHDAGVFQRLEDDARAELASVPAGSLPRRVIPVAANETIAIIRHALHDEAGATKAIEAATAAEDAQPSHVQPTMPVLPAHEVYAAMLMERNQPQYAIMQYAASMKTFANRALPLLGIARAERATGDRARAARDAAAFAALWSGADPDRPELREAVAMSP